MYGCESWTIKKAECQRTDAFELVLTKAKALESPLDCKSIKPVHPKGNQPWIFIGRTDAEAEAPILRPLTHWKRPWSWERLKAGGEDDDRGWDGWLASPTRWHEFEHALRVGDGQGSLACSSQSMGFTKSQTWLSNWIDWAWLVRQLGAQKFQDPLSVLSISQLTGNNWCTYE